MNEGGCDKIVAWVRSNILPHEVDVRLWLGLSKNTVVEIVKRSRAAVCHPRSPNVLSCPFYVVAPYRATDVPGGNHVGMALLRNAGGGFLELKLRAAALNRLSKIGTPNTVRVAY